jgi:hypothetical protein
MKVFLVAQQWEGAYTVAFSTLEKALAYAEKNDFVVEVELDNPNTDTIMHDPHKVILYRA